MLSQPKLTTLALLVVSATCTGCQTGHYADRGALTGGLTGAAIGTAIGDHNDNALLGAVTGAAAGSFVGSAIGGSIDQEIDREINREINRGQFRAQSPNAVTVDNVILMSSNGLGDETIENHIRANGVAASMTPNDLIRLKSQGVSERVILAMQSRQQQIPVRVAAPTIIHEDHYLHDAAWHAAWQVPHPVHHNYHHGHVPHNDAGWGFSIHSGH